MAANVGTLPSGLSIGAGQAIRRNAGDSAWEAFTPSSGGMTIGDAVSGGGANRVLYEDGSQNLAASSTFTYVASSKQLTVDSIKLTNPTASTIFIGGNPHGSYSGTNNVVLGIGAGAAIQAGTLNLLLGSRAGEAITSGVGNLLAGYAAGYGINTGSYNVGFGYALLSGNASDRVAIGRGAIGAGTGNNNVGIGARAGTSLTTGYANTLIGSDYAGGLINSGVNNVCIGGSAGANITYGGNNVAIGNSTSVDSASGSNQTNINNTFFGTSTEARIHRATYKQRYDASNYLQVDVSSAGAVTFDAVGSSAGFTFADSITLADAKDIILNATTGTKIGTANTQKMGFYGVTPVAQQGVTGSRASGAALVSLLSALNALGLISDTTTV